MSTFNMQIVTPDGLFFNGKAEKIIVRAAMGDLCVLAGHADLVSPINEGAVKITLENGNAKTARCKGGFISIKRNTAKIVSCGFVWTDDNIPY